MYLVSTVVCSLVVFLLHITYMDVHCKPYVDEIDKSSEIILSTPLFNDVASISTPINDESDNSNTPLFDNSNISSNEDIGESHDTSQESSPNNWMFSGFSAYPATEVHDICILERSEFYLSWWVYENGSLRLPTLNRTAMSGILDLSLQLATESILLELVLSFTAKYPNEMIRIMSIANNLLKKIPSSVLNLTSTLQYLSLADNNFYSIFEEENTSFENFTTFPLLNNLLELDLRNCHMTSLQSSYFVNLPNLMRLFASHNYFTIIRADDMHSLENLQHLDLSYNMVPPGYSAEFEGLYLQEDLFKHLPNLMFLDLSHTKLTQNSTKALRHLGPSLTQISLCYTNLKTIAVDTFSNTNLKVVDFSGNKELYDSLTPHHFQSVDESLEIFVFRNGNIKSKHVFTYLSKLRMLDLRNNIIDSLAPFDFGLMQNLEILDLGYNNINNWKSRAFAENKNIKVLNLRSNNITIIEDPMLADFYETRYLAIGSNNFECACNLRDFIDRASRNALYHHCNQRRKRSIDLGTAVEQYNIFHREFKLIASYYELSYRNILAPIFQKLNSKAMGSVKALNQKVDDSTASIGLKPFNENDCYDFDSSERTHMNFNFLLLDYNENDYKCSEKIEYSGNRSRFFFNEIASCFNEEYETTGPSYEGDGGSTEKSKEPEHTTTPILEKLPFRNLDIIFLNFLFVIPVVIIASIIFHYRADIKYFLSIFKNSVILSLDTDDKKALMLANRKKSTNSVDQYTYDVFVSYSDNDRAWVLDEFIPNIEKRSEINICLHERDFQVGLSILENIIQCMDKSRCILLVVSESFIKSNWCAFEMHLAQHRLIETRREQLILVLLHDIPRARRTRTLQFLMRTKTYIMWPNDGKEESQSIFWKRLKKSIVLSDWEQEGKRTPKKQRHSIV